MTEMMFYLIVAAFGLAIVFAAAVESVGLSFLATVALFLFLELLAGVQVTAWVAAHPWVVVGAAAAYLPLGICWSLFRWNWYVGGELRHVSDRRSDWYVNQFRDIAERLAARAAYLAGGLPESHRAAWEKHIDESAPLASNFKSRICFWIAYWPISAAWWFIGDLLTELVEKIYRCISKWFDAIVERQKRKAKL
jgi:hypothetical protein